ncbi:hypothetical protein SRHO_G00302730 [Serrasalmus rhombeus]
MLPDFEHELPKADFYAGTPAERLSFRHLDGNKAEIVTLEDEDVVAMGTLNPTVTQVLPGRDAWWGCATRVAPAGRSAFFYYTFVECFLETYFNVRH